MLDATNLLKKAGASPELAEALVQVVSDLSHSQVATKLDLAEVKTELKQDIAELRQEIGKLEIRLIKSMGAGFVVTIGILAGLMKYLLNH